MSIPLVALFRRGCVVGRCFARTNVPGRRQGGPIAAWTLNGKEKSVHTGSIVLAAGESVPWYIVLLYVGILLIGIFMILLILIQRGKGGGLSGALGGVGGSSAFGTRAGDQFTRVTIYVAVVWVLVIMITIKLSAPYASTDQTKSDSKKDEQKGGSSTRVFQPGHYVG